MAMYNKNELFETRIITPLSLAKNISIAKLGSFYLGLSDWFMIFLCSEITLFFRAQKSFHLCFFKESRRRTFISWKIHFEDACFHFFQSFHKKVSMKF